MTNPAVHTAPLGCVPRCAFRRSEVPASEARVSEARVSEGCREGNKGSCE